MAAKQEMGDWSGGPRAQPWDIKTWPRCTTTGDREGHKAIGTGCWLAVKNRDDVGTCLRS